MRVNTGTFGEGVQQYLRSSGHSQKELADELGLHPKVLSRKLHGSANAYLTHQEIQQILSMLAQWHAITTEDEALHLLAAAQVKPAIISEEDWQSPPLNTLTKKHTPSAPSSPASFPVPPASPLHNLPPPATRLIGREWAVTRLQQLFARDDVRLVTLVGAGGSGKTRLAQHLARELVGSFIHGVWFVHLAGLTDPTLVPMSIMQALTISSTPDVSPLQTLVAYLRNKQLLLVLDNFEQVSEAADAVGELLAATSGLRVLVTSRAVLRLYGEHEFSVPPLDVPDTGIALLADELARYGSVQLFVERARAGNPDFTLTGENAPFIAQICARLDGLPLALELATARLRVLPPAQLLERLSRSRLPLLTGGARNLPDRHHTLRNTIAWSYNLLSPTEQAWFRRLGVFTGSWPLEAAEAMMLEMIDQNTDRGHTVEVPATVSSQKEDVATAPLEMLEHLVDHSLIVQSAMASSAATKPGGGHGQARFTMLETLREYAVEQLLAHGELERMRDWHAGYYLQEAEAAELGLRSSQQLTWLARLRAELDNFRVALEWSLQRARDGLRIHTLAHPAQNSSTAGRTVAGSSTLSQQSGSSADPFALEVALRLASALRHSWEWQGNLTEARHWLNAALQISLPCDADKTVLAARAKALSEYARLTCLHNDQPRAIELAEESIALFRRLDDPVGLAGALLHRAWPAIAVCDYETATSGCQEGLRLLSTSASNDLWLRGQLLFYIGAAAAFNGDFEGMRSFYTQSRDIFAQVGDTSSVADVLKDWGALSLLEGECKVAIELLLKSLRLCYQLDQRQYMTTGMCSFSLAVGLRGEPDPETASIHSAQLDGIADNLSEMIGLTQWTKNNPFIKTVYEFIRSRVDAETWEAAWRAGRALTLEQAIDLACELGE